MDADRGEPTVGEPTMSGVVTVALALMGLLTPDGLLLARRLQGSDDLPPLPVTALQATASRLQLDPTPMPSGIAVAYRGAPSRSAKPSSSLWGRRLAYDARWLQDEPTDLEVESPGGDAAARRLVLVPRHRLGLDVAEYLFHGLTVAWLEEQRWQERPGLDSRFMALARQRADLLMPEVPAEARLSCYLGAMADFASQLLAIAHEVDRTRRRWQLQGRDVCELRQADIPLLRLWQQVFQVAQFRGSYLAPAEDVDGTAPPQSGAQGSPPRRWRQSRGLAAEDKTLMVEHLFAGHWSGVAVDDFAELCQPPPDDIGHSPSP